MSGFKYISKAWKNGRWNYLYKRAKAVVRFGVNKTKSDYKVTRREGNYVTDKNGQRQWTKPQYVSPSNSLWTARMREKADSSRQKANAAWNSRKEHPNDSRIRRNSERLAQEAKRAEDAYLKRLKAEVDDVERNYKRVQEKANKARKRKWYDVINRFNDWSNKRDANEARMRRNGKNQYYQQELRRLRKTKR